MKIQKNILSTVAAVFMLANTSLYAEDNSLSDNSGLHQIITIIENDTRLNKRVSSANISKAVDSAQGMNEIILEAIIANGLANDALISTADTREINDYIFENYAGVWSELHGDDEDGEETGFHLVQNNGAKTKLFGKNAVNRVADGIYHLGFETHRKNRLLNEDGNNNTKFLNVGDWLTKLLADDLAKKSLQNQDIVEVTGSTNTGLDKIIEIIYTDDGLGKRISTGDMREASSVSDGMNKLIIEAIVELGLANDGRLSTADIRDINNYLVENYKEQWSQLHGDDEDAEETGFHLVQNDGAKTKLFGKNAINRVADSIYHLGFETHKKNRLLNEDGNKNRSFRKVAEWVSGLLVDDLSTESLKNSEVSEVIGETNTGLDQIITLIYGDARLEERVATSDIREASRSANEMNKLIIEAIQAVNASEDAVIDADDARKINEYLVANYAEEWKILHGDDEDGEETGFHLVQNDGAKTKLFGKNAINNIADSIYHLGFEAASNRLQNEDGNDNKRFKKVASWLNLILIDDLENGRI